MEIDGETLIHRAARIASEVDEVIVVTKPAFVVEYPTIINENADEGIASSIRAGVAACDDDVLITLCDQPYVTAEHLRALVAANAPIAATAYSGTIGVPAYFAREFRDELLALRGDHGAKRVIEAHRDVVKAIPFEAAAIDVD